MRTLLLLFFSGSMLLALSPSVEALPVHNWSKRFGSGGSQFAYATVVDGSGNVIITGEIRNSADFGGGALTSAGGSDIFVARFNANGTHSWSKRFGATLNQIGRSVAVDGSGNVVITGEISGSADFGGGVLTSAGGTDLFVAKFDASGNHLWSKRFGDGSAQVGNGVVVDGSGNIIVTGELRGTVNFGGGPLTSGGGADIFVLKLDANGNHVWSARFGDVSRQVGKALAVDGAGEVVVTGELAGTADFGGGPLTSAGVADVFLAKFSAAGAHVWSKRFGDGSAQLGDAVAMDASGNVVVITGELNGSTDFGGGLLTSAGGIDIFVARFDAGGSHVWSKRFGATGDQVGSSVAVVSSGSAVVTGRFQTSTDFGGGTILSAGNFDVFLAKYDAAGTHQWSQAFGDANNQQGFAVAADGSGGVVLTGRLSGAADFGGGLLTSAGGADIFLVSFFDQYFVPVLIRSIQATPRDGAVEISWEVWSDEGLESFALYRRDDATSAPTGIAAGSLNGGTHSYLDTSVEPGRTYYYEVAIRTRGGSEFRSTVAAVTTSAWFTTLGQNHPNPFNPITTIDYTLGERSSVALSIYDAQGALVARLPQGQRDAGRYRVEWDGRDDAGLAVSSGVYFYRIEGVTGIGAKKMVLLK